MPPSPAAASGSAPSRPTITVLVTAIALCARLAAASGSASANVARNSARNPSAGFIWSLSKRKGPDRYRRGPRIVACRLCSAHAHALRPHGNAARVGGLDEVLECANHGQFVDEEHATVNSPRHASYFRLGAGALGDEAVVLDAAVLFEIEDCALDVVAEIEVERCGNDLVVLAQCAGSDLAGRRDDRRAADQPEPILLAGFCRGQHPGSVLIGVGLHGDEMVEHPQMHRFGMVHVLGRRVVAERDDLDALQPHDAEGFRPAPVVADAHADDGVEGAPHFEALVADIEIALFEMLERRVGQMLGMPRQVNLAIAADDPPVVLYED